MTTAYFPDVVVTLDTEEGSLRVNLARGGEKFPWAAHQGRVIIGPPDGSCTSDGTPMDSLNWNIAPYWVVEAFDEEGEGVELDPYLYGRAVQAAVDQCGGAYDYGFTPDNDTAWE
jgi:hypothetical protein